MRQETDAKLNIFQKQLEEQAATIDQLTKKNLKLEKEAKTLKRQLEEEKSKECRAKI